MDKTSEILEQWSDDAARLMNDRYCEIMSAALHPGTTTTGEQELEPLTIDKLREVLETIPKCPFEQYMTKEGFPPSNGGVMYISPIWLYNIGLGEHQLPDYVRMSPLANPIILTWDSFPRFPLRIKP